jgi:uncharacterized membrane protein
MQTSHISSQSLSSAAAVNGGDIREGVFDLIVADHPTFTKNDFISYGELNAYRRSFLTSLIIQERTELAAIDQDVVTAIKNNTVLTENLQDDTETPITSGQKIADKVATFGGSWTFIITFFSFIVIWILVNIWVLTSIPFDPYPFILLNLLLSCLAAIQAPIIMMSQNRQEQKDRLRAEHDYKINLKAELEIKLLNEKMDHLLIHQNKKLIEIQQVQIDYLEDLMKSQAKT